MTTIDDNTDRITADKITVYIKGTLLDIPHDKLSRFLILAAKKALEEGKYEEYMDELRVDPVDIMIRKNRARPKQASSPVKPNTAKAATKEPTVIPVSIPVLDPSRKSSPMNNPAYESEVTVENEGSGNKKWSHPFD